MENLEQSLKSFFTCSFFECVGLCIKEASRAIMDFVDCLGLK